MIAFPKPVTYENRDYLEFIKTLPCAYCGKDGVDPHHVRRLYWGSGIGKKPHDYVAIPLCREHHNPDIEQFLNVERVIISCLMKYIKENRDTPNCQNKL